MANNLFVAYDLISPGQNYEAVTNAIKQLGAWAKIEQSLFYVKTTYTDQQAAQHVAASMDANDKLIVITATSAFQKNLPKTVVDQLTTHWNL